MEHQKISIGFDVYDSIDQLAKEDADLLHTAYQATDISYAPYSKFYVGAAARLANGQTVLGSNQENASYPVGICAERVLLSAASSVYPKIPILTLAISCRTAEGKSNKPISPCGICRQTLVEYESLLKHPIRLILGGIEGKIYIINGAQNLLPFSFSGDDMK